MRFALTLLMLLLSSPLLAAGLADNIVVEDPYLRMPPPGSKITAGYMKLKNTGQRAIKLVSATVPLAKVTELHTHINDNGILRMRQVNAIAIPANGEVAFQPSGYHLMLIDLVRPLQEGERVAMTLSFDDGSSKAVFALVKKSLLGLSVPAVDQDGPHH